MSDSTKTAKICFFEVAPWEARSLRRHFGKTPVWYTREKLNPTDLRPLRSCEVLSFFIYSRLTAELLKLLPNLKLVATRSTGFDHIDTAALKRRKIALANVPSYGENTVAEHTFALILALSRNIHRAYVRTTRSDFTIEGLTGFDLKGRTMGVIGAGHIGLHVVKMAKGFGMDVLVMDTRQDPFLAEVLGFAYVDLPTLLSRSDIVTLHLPHTPKTHHILNRANLRLMKRGSLLINTARGGLVETEALVEALDRGILAGAGLDVLEGEDLVKEESQLLSRNFPEEKLKTLVRNNILLHRDDVVITPHIAFNSREALERIIHTTYRNIESFLAGHPQNLVL